MVCRAGKENECPGAQKGISQFFCYETAKNDDARAVLLPDVDGLEVVRHVVRVGALDGVAVSDGGHHGEALAGCSKFSAGVTIRR